MVESIETTPSSDPTLSEVNFSAANNVFAMNIITLNKTGANTLNGRLIALRRLYETDAPDFQNFSIELDESRNTIRLIGNIFNAIKILSEAKPGIFSDQLLQAIDGNSKVKAIIENSKNYVLPENRMDEQAPTDQDTQVADVSAKQEAYLEGFFKLNPDDQDRVLQHLQGVFASNGFEISVTRTPRNTTTLVV